MALDRTQANAVLAAIRDSGLDPLEFMWDAAVSGKRRARISHPYGAFFSFLFAHQGWEYDFMPGMYGEPRSQGIATSWYSELEAVARWLEALRTELEAPDLWAELEREREALSRPAAEGGDNSPFAGDELTQVSARIDELIAYTREALELNQEQQRITEARLRLLERSARSGTGRIDWWNQLTGALLNLVLTGVIPPHAIQSLLVLAATALAGLFGGAPPGLPGGGHPPMLT